MVESAAVLNPSKGFNPGSFRRLRASDMVTVEALQKEKEISDAAVVCYVNPGAEVKAESDVCCTSSNAVEIVSALPNKNSFYTRQKFSSFCGKTSSEEKLFRGTVIAPFMKRLMVEYIIEAKQKTAR